METTRHIAVALLLAPLAVLLASSSACKTDYQQGLEDPHYGLPNALAGARQPGPTSGDDTSGPGNTGFACVKAGGTLVDGGTCAVSFKTDVLGAFTAAKCDDKTCHGGATPPNEPAINATDAPGTYNRFAGFKLTIGKLYINPCSTDPGTSTLASNINANANAADRGALMPLGSNGLGQDVVTKLETWLKCGSPNN